MAFHRKTTEFDEKTAARALGKVVRELPADVQVVWMTLRRNGKQVTAHVEYESEQQQ